MMVRQKIKIKKHLGLHDVNVRITAVVVITHVLQKTTF